MLYKDHVCNHTIIYNNLAGVSLGTWTYPTQQSNNRSFITIEMVFCSSPAKTDESDCDLLKAKFCTNGA